MTNAKTVYKQTGAKSLYKRMLHSLERGGCGIAMAGLSDEQSLICFYVFAYRTGEYSCGRVRPVLTTTLAQQSL
jgi:hypothetical protein